MEAVEFSGGEGHKMMLKVSENSQKRLFPSLDIGYNFGWQQLPTHLNILC
jgi:hypothetical protein